MNNNLIHHRLPTSSINSINELIDEVGKKQLKDFGEINSDIKADGTLITECDKWSDTKIVNELTRITNNKEGILSEEGSKKVPNTNSFWIVDPLDGTTNFAAGIPFWAISIARFQNGQPETAFLDIPVLKKRIFAIRGKGVWINNRKVFKKHISLINNNCVSLCSRSIKILQLNPNNSFPGKIRLLGVSSLNMTSVALGQTIGALEATPKIWDLAAAWLILSELDCTIKWLDSNPKNIQPGQDLSTQNFPLLTVSTSNSIDTFMPWANILIES